MTQRGSKKPENPPVDWRNPEDRQRYLKTKLKPPRFCPLIDEEGVCIPSLETPRGKSGEIVPFHCYSMNYEKSCGVYEKYMREHET